MKTIPTYIAGTNCITPLGFDVESNVQNILQGISGISLHQDNKLLENPFHAAIIDDEKINAAFSAISNANSYTRLEKMMILALQPLLKDIKVNGRSVLIVSTTKGNITSLTKNNTIPDNAYLAELAQNIADFYGITTQPVVVSNACASGIMAVGVAKRLLQSGMYDNAFVVSGDEVSAFVLSGFNSFQALSDTPCKPYSANRNGVTLGEAAAAVLVTKEPKGALARIAGEASINDANHISGPSRTGEGLVRSITKAMSEAGIEANYIDYISAHGTATVFNDEMEAIAFNRTGLAEVPVNSFKGYYGHTLGASGLLETVLAVESMTRSRLFASLGYDEPGVSQPINVITQNSHKEINYFLKTASGFGGCNTAVIFEKVESKYYLSGYCSIENNRIIVDGQTVFEAADLPFTEFAKKAYQQFETPYPKFFKMDNLSKLAFLAAGQLLRSEVNEDAENDIALLFANKSSSLDTDAKFNEQIADRDNYYPSPAVFVYTLPNICLGEISIRYRLYTENSFFIFAAFNPEFFEGYTANLLDSSKAEKVLCGWVEFYGQEYKAFMYMVSKEGSIGHNADTIKKLYDNGSIES